MLTQFILSGRCPRLEDHEGRRNFAPLFVGHSHDLVDGWMAGQHLFDLYRRNHYCPVKSRIESAG